MTEPSEKFYLAIEPLCAECCALFGTQNFESDGAFMANVAREIDRGHSSLAKLAFESVPARECVTQVRGNIGSNGRFQIFSL